MDTKDGQSCVHHNNRAPNASGEESYENASCLYFSSGRCRSCGLLDRASGERVSTKSATLRATLAAYGIAAQSVEPITLPESPWESRYKIKMSVAGTLEEPIIGLADAAGKAEDLSDCPLMPMSIRALMHGLKGVIRDARVAPYDIQKRQGELKGIIVMLNRAGSQGILRFVLRSSEATPRIRKCIEALRKQHPWVHVVSCNIQPLHAAIPEGPEEIVLTEEHYIEELYGGVPLFFAPQSFMQVTPEIAERLYHRAAVFAEQNRVSSVLDLFCGVGGFSFAVAPFVRHVTGVEVSPMAVQSAQRTAERLGYTHTTFTAADVDDALTALRESNPDLIIVNPPRRGLSEQTKAFITESRPRYVIYSSCNPETFARDVRDIAAAYALESVAPFDMFPLTEHCEVLGIFRQR
jgi:23S rRNA (uracil747-C5)-methyltransferase